MKAAPIAKTRGRGRTHRPKEAPRGDLAPLTLLDILPNRSATIPEGRDSPQAFGKISTGIIGKPSSYRAKAT